MKRTGGNRAEWAALILPSNMADAHVVLEVACINYLSALLTTRFNICLNIFYCKKFEANISYVAW